MKGADKFCSEGEEHIILEQAYKPANPWRNERWDSFTLVTPRSVFNIPGTLYKGSEPDSFMTRTEVVQFFEDYIKNNNLPIRYNTRVNSVKLMKQGSYLLGTSTRDYISDNVIIATGYYQKPKMPRCTSVPDDIKIMHSSQYRNHESIPSGSVLIIGSAESGSQIAEELNEKGRKVFLSIGRAGRIPRRYRGKDIIHWLELLGLFNLSADQLPPGASKYDGIPQLSGTKGGHTINLHQFARDGITLLGHLKEIKDRRAYFEADLHTNLKMVDGFETEIVNMIDSYIASNGLDAPEEKLPEMNDGYNQPIIEELDLSEFNINTIISGMGYKFDYSFIDLPVREPDGFPLQERGITKYPGLYFAGMPWMPSERSGFLVGVGDSVKYIVSNLISRKTERVTV